MECEGGPAIISIHAPAKGATTENDVRFRWNYISIHAPAKGATRPVCGMDGGINFNPRSREGSDMARHPHQTLPGLFQSTLPRRERPNGTVTANVTIDISIHAPAKGATICHLCIGNRPIISIHAPAKGATKNTECGIKVLLFQSTLPRRERPSWHRLWTLARRFQSTLPRRERLHDFRHKPALSLISIHAPAKGATKWNCDCQCNH